MSERSVMVCPPTRRDGRQVWVDGKPMGEAQSLRALTELLNAAGWDDMDEVDVAEWEVIEWYGGGPEVWSLWSDPWPVSARQPGSG
ncbi:hypothetical protein CW362_08690 [Streptomyces populi]|uniref:Uncharacterized protein n=1 Tax=Streptomyces populi TaxID=2058924 RepID=A0A2I0SU35_9ACTN|nr:hypothetical protein [Streptomyces populi]PKT73415.1 hypothetical protein CW362_08690 [Streptomyces populi]